jgi:hypothetical protein
LNWLMSHRFDRQVVPIADRHYNRQTHGSPQVAPPGSCLVLKAIDGDQIKAFWITSVQKYVMHDWPNAWNCSAFRNEGAGLSSDLVREAVAVTRYHYGEVPAGGMITFVNAAKVKHKRDPGRCFIKAGFKLIGKTKSGLLVFGLSAEDMPEAQAPKATQAQLFEAA